MVLNYIWIAFFVIAFLFGLVELCFMGNTEVFTNMVQATFDSSKTAFETSLGLTGVLAMLAHEDSERAGAVNVLARVLSPVFTKLFPDIPKNHPVMGSIFMNIASNMLGLDNAATPTGLKAMQQMQELNTRKDTATNPMIMFLVLNTSGLTIIPTTILAFRAAKGAAMPTDVSFLSSSPRSVATLCRYHHYRSLAEDNLFQPLLLLTLGGLIASVGVIVWGFGQMDKDTMALVTNVTANVILLGIIVTFIAMGAFKKINVYDAFIEGAKDGFHTAVSHHPLSGGDPCGRGRVSCLWSDGYAGGGHCLVCQSLRSGRPICRCAPHSLHEAA